MPGLIIGYEHSFTHQVADFLEGLRTGKPAAPTFRDALETNRVCDAIIASGKSRPVGEACMKLGFNLLLWTTHVTDAHWPIIERPEGHRL